MYVVFWEVCILKGADALKSLKYIAMILCVIMTALSVGCGKEKKTAKADGQPFFELVSTPEITVDDEVVSVCKRFNENYTASLTASDAYGELLPFVGGFYTYTSTDEKSTRTVQNPVYGLCTADGSVVVDAVYDYVKVHPKDDGGFVYELAVGGNDSDPLAGTRYIAASNGSWVFKVPKRCEFFRAFGDRIVFARHYSPSKKVEYIYHEFYDFNGKKKYTFDKALSEDPNTEYTFGVFSEGVLPVNITVTDPKTKAVTKTAYFIDSSGKQVFEKLTYCEEFCKGYAVAANKDGLYGVLDTKGNWFIEPKYRVVNYNSDKGYFACADKGFFSIFNMKKEQVKKVFTEQGNVEVLNAERLVYKITNHDTGRSECFFADDEEPFACVETGQFPDGNPQVEGLYVCVYSGTGTVFKEDGKTVVNLGDFGRLADRFGNTVVAVNANGKKTCFISVSTGQRTEWMRGIYMEQSVADRYVVIKNPDNEKYGLYDLFTNAYTYENCDYIEVFNNGGQTFLSIVNDGRATVYNKELAVVMTTPQTARY